MIEIWAGGQDGTDQAALDAAINCGLKHDGWCPKGRRCESGRIPERFKLRETATDDYKDRTFRNIIDTKATVIFSLPEGTKGTNLTRDIARYHNRPILEIPFIDIRKYDPEHTWEWITRFSKVNFAGPRESHRPGYIYSTVLDYLTYTFKNKP